jgi:hypothetical protein
MPFSRLSDGFAFIGMNGVAVELELNGLRVELRSA